MKLWSWYAHSWYPGNRWEIGFDLRRWAIGASQRQRETTLFLGPLIVCFDRSMAW